MLFYKEEPYWSSLILIPMKILVSSYSILLNVLVWYFYCHFHVSFSLFTCNYVHGFTLVLSLCSDYMGSIEEKQIHVFYSTCHFLLPNRVLRVPWNLVHTLD